jgi:nitronate monooxygenase
MIWKTRINQITGTKYPVLMGAFGGLGRTEFAAAFSNAGGLGIITALNYPNAADFKQQLEKMRDLTDKPFGVNFSVIPQNNSGTFTHIMSNDDYLNLVEIALDEGVNIFTTSIYKATFIGERVHEAGAYWFHKCVLFRHIPSVINAGVDAITLSGMEASGFKNPYQHTTLTNITVAKRWFEVPLIAAGGIGDARGFLGALGMGAEAVCFGTAILATKESPLSPDRKNYWFDIDIKNEIYFKRLYHHTLGSSGVPSTAIAHQNKSVHLKEFLDGVMSEAETILRSWGFTSNEFNTIPK